MAAAAGSINFRFFTEEYSFSWGGNIYDTLCCSYIQWNPIGISQRCLVLGKLE